MCRDTAQGERLVLGPLVQTPPEGLDGIGREGGSFQGFGGVVLSSSEHPRFQWLDSVVHTVLAYAIPTLCRYGKHALILCRTVLRMGTGIPRLVEAGYAVGEKC